MRCWTDVFGRGERARGRLGKALLGMGCSWKREAWFAWVYSASERLVDASIVGYRVGSKD